MASRENTISVSSGASRPDYKKIRKDSKDFKKLYDLALYYIHCEYADKKLKEETIKYAKVRKLDYGSLDKFSNHRFSVLGKPCVVINNGGEAPENWENYTLVEIERLITLSKTSTDEADEESLNDSKPAPNQIGIQDRMLLRAADVCGEFEGWVDTFMESPSKFNPESYDFRSAMIRAELKAGHARHIVSFYASDLDEINKVLAGDDPQLKEGYSCYTKPQIKKLEKFYQRLIADAKMIIDTSKVSRKPSVKKAVSKDKQVAKIQYQKDDAVLKLVSQHPVNILSAKEVWIYNTKTRKIGKYVALDESGFGVKGVSITNYSEELSVEKTLRKPIDQLAEFKRCSKAALRKYLESIPTVDTKLRGRLADTHIILKIEK